MLKALARSAGLRRTARPRALGRRINEAGTTDGCSQAELSLDLWLQASTTDHVLKSLWRIDSMDAAIGIPEIATCALNLTALEECLPG